MEDKNLILIVDDVPHNLQVLGEILDVAGYEVAAALNGYQALEAVERETPDLILLDVMMPELDGFAVCERLKANAASRDIPVIFLTARVESEAIVRGFEVGAVDYVTKPVNRGELLARVKLHLELVTARRELKAQNEALQQALNEIQTLRGIIPICSHCKKIRDDKGSWEQIELYVQQHSEAVFSHGICPSCMKILYGNEDWYQEVEAELKK
jgi:PleD family two-component response regulator